MTRIQYVNGDSLWIHEAERTLKQHGAVSLRFVSQRHWAAKKRMIYQNFKNYEVTIEQHSPTSYEVLITQEMIRTNRIQQGQGIAAAALGFPVELPAASRGIEGFDDMYLCACCGQYLRDKEFAHRMYNDHRYRQSYCRSCMHLYNIWRTSFLKEHGIIRLTPDFIAGYKQRNEYFRAWYAARCLPQSKVKAQHICYDEMVRIVKCKHCGRYEYFGEMRWLNGRCECRTCYKHHREELDRRSYDYTDLDGERPTEEEFLIQEDRYCDICSSRECTGCEHQH
jgi:hypothetical protein